MRRELVWLLLVLALIVFPGVGRAGGREITVRLDGWEQNFAPSPLIKDGRVLLPMRDLFEALGAKVEWIAATSTVIATKGDKKVELSIGSPQAKVNGRLQPLDVPAQIIEDKTMVPLRLVAEALGAREAWDQDAGAVTIDTYGETFAKLFPGDRNLHIPQAVAVNPLTGRVYVTMEEDKLVEIDGSTGGIINSIESLWVHSPQLAALPYRKKRS